MSWAEVFVNGIAREAMRTDLVDGLKAYVRLYYDENTDATEVEAEGLRAMDTLLGMLPFSGPTEDVYEIVSEVEGQINAEGGVRSEGGKRHKVCTFVEEKED